MRAIVSIQALRALAALSVVLCHCFDYHWQMTGHHGQGQWARLASGVDLFFVISGFVMVYSSESLFAARGAPLTFMRHRLARIVPLYWVATTVWLMMGTPFDLSSVVSSYLFIPCRNPGGAINPVYGVGWTLNFEMLFYVTFAGCLLFRKAWAVALLAGMLLGAVALGRARAMPYAPLALWTNPLVLEFLAGAGIALLFKRGTILPTWARITMILAAVGAIAFYGDPVTSPFPEIGEWRWIQWGIPAAAIVAASVLGSQRWLEGRLGGVARPLGDASYSLYLLHILVLHFFVPPAFANAQPLYLVAGFMTSVALSLVTYRYFERPLTNMLKRPARATMPLSAPAQV